MFRAFEKLLKVVFFFRFLKPLMIYLPKFKTKYNPNGCYDNKRKSILRTITLILLCQFYDSQNVKMTIPSQHTYVSKRLKALSLPGYRSEGSPHYNDEALVSLVLWVSIDNVLGRVFHNDTGLCNRSFIVPWNLQRYNNNKYWYLCIYIRCNIFIHIFVFYNNIYIHYCKDCYVHYFSTIFSDRILYDELEINLLLKEILVSITYRVYYHRD